MALIPMVQSRDQYAKLLAELADALEDPSANAIEFVRNELSRIATGCDLFAHRLAELVRKLMNPTALAIRVVRNELARLAQG